ncbi:MAG: hypothetical protein QW117_00575 [Candidatus Pacearchaeota archaeon]
MEDNYLCIKCKGKGLCGKKCPILNKFKIKNLKKTYFSSSLPPEIFVSTYNYPNVNSGILSPEEYGDTSYYSSSEIWYKNNYDIEKILFLRSNLIYSKFKTKIKYDQKNKFLEIAKEISLTNKPVSAEIFLLKPIKNKILINNYYPVIGNPAPLKNIRLGENIKTERKAEYLLNDIDVKAEDAIIELYKSKLKIEQIIRLLSVGNLGRKKERKLVPTRWSITATDDIISRKLLEKIKTYQEISEILVFNSYYIGNHYEFILIPDKFSFEVIEAKLTGSVWNPNMPTYFAIDYEDFYGRKKYAKNVTGAYYANRLALCEYLKKIKRQAACLVIRECRKEYYAPCGVGVLREASRGAFSKEAERFSSLKDAFEVIQKRLKLPIKNFIEKSWLIKKYKEQKKITYYLSN